MTFPNRPWRPTQVLHTKPGAPIQGLRDCLYCVNQTNHPTQVCERCRIDFEPSTDDD